jgi:hypothetical protein
MKKVTGFVLGLILSNNVFALDNAVENFQALCGLAKQGKYSQIQGKAQLQADGSVKLASFGGKGEISFSKGEWDGVNQVLQAHQAGNLHDYRACVANALPYFKSKVVIPTANKSKPKPEKQKTKAATNNKPAIAKTEPAKPQPECDVEGDQNVSCNSVGGDMNINFGVKP